MENEKTPIFKRINVDDAVWLKNTPIRRFVLFFGHWCVASHVASDPPPPPPPAGRGGLFQRAVSVIFKK